MKVSDQLRQAGRQLTPAQQTDVQSIKNKIEAVERNVQSAKSSLEKWLQGERFDPQKDNLVQDLKATMQAARAALSVLEKLN
jgi:molecular chaperone GrpE (heat shock protein)